MTVVEEAQLQWIGRADNGFPHVHIGSTPSTFRRPDPAVSKTSSDV